VLSPSPRLRLEERLRDLYAATCEVVAATRPDAVVIEELYSTYKNPLTAISPCVSSGRVCRLC